VGTDTERLREEIEQTREELGRDVDALTDKVSPTRVVGRRVERVKGAASGVKDKVMGGASDTATGAGDRVSATGDRLSSAASDLGDRAGSAAGTVRAQAEGNPLAAGLVAFGLGWLVGSLLPASDAEARAAERAKATAQEKGQPVVEELKAAATEMKDNLQQPAQEAAEAVRSSATEAASSVQDQAKGAASDVAQEGKQAGQRVKGEAQSSAESVRSTADSPGPTFG
jgi:hypothetical protein